MTETLVTPTILSDTRGSFISEPITRLICLRSSEFMRSNLIFIHLLHAEGFDDVAVFDVLIAGERDAAVVVLGDLADILFAVAEGGYLTREHGGAVADEASLRPAQYLAVGDMAARDHAHARDTEGLSDFGGARADL